MTVLARTAEHLAEFESGMLSIARRSDGHCVAMSAPRLSSDFRACIKSHGVDKTIATYIKIGERLGGWRPLYKVSAMPRLLGDKA